MSDYLKTIAKNRFSVSQKVMRYTEGEKFDGASKHATRDQLILIEKYITTSDIEKLKHICEVLIPQDTEAKTVIQLRIIARNLGVDNYQSASKASLLSGIKRKESENAASGTVRDVPAICETGKD